MVEIGLGSLWLPIVLSTVALFFLGFLSWMVLGLHKADWNELPDEDAFGKAVRDLNVQPGSYMFPFCADAEQMKSPEFIEKQKQGPVGIVQIWEETGGMGKQLGCQFVFLLVTMFCLAYLATLGVPAGAEFMQVFRFVGTAGILFFTVANVPTSIWFRSRITGHIIDGVLLGLTAGIIFALLWPGAPTAG
ncbi:MAG: hypothetical protein ACR2NM_03500 [Bythopirellula sp.]